MLARYCRISFDPWFHIRNNEIKQVCVAPDYILVPRNQQDALISAFKKAYESFWPYPNGPLNDESEFANVNITPTNQDRIKNLISGTKGTVVIGGQSKGKRVALTIIKDVKEDDLLMEESVITSYFNKIVSETKGFSEIFGPVLPIVPVDDVNDAIRIIRNHPAPLVIYVFTENEATKNLCKNCCYDLSHTDH